MFVLTAKYNAKCCMKRTRITCLCSQPITMLNVAGREQGSYVCADSQIQCHDPGVPAGWGHYWDHHTCPRKRSGWPWVHHYIHINNNLVGSPGPFQYFHWSVRKHLPLTWQTSVCTCVWKCERTTSNCKKLWGCKLRVWVDHVERQRPLLLMWCLSGIRKF